jgi:hypothetical protein
MHTSNQFHRTCAESFLTAEQCPQTFSKGRPLRQQSEPELSLSTPQEAGLENRGWLARPPPPGLGWAGLGWEGKSHGMKNTPDGGGEAGLEKLAG